VKPYAIPLVAGTLCLPLTYWPTRYEFLPISIGIILAVAILSTWLSVAYMHRTARMSAWWELALAFALGAIAIETLFFANYYFGVGQSDRKLDVGIFLLILEGGVIAVLGALTVTGTYFAIRRITGTSRATR
jgi:hypothetical protein